MGKPSERIYIIEADPITGEVDRGKVLQTISDFIGTLFAVGGKLQIAADRVAVGEVMVGQSPQPIAETHALVIRYQSFAPIRNAAVPAPPLQEQQAEQLSADPTPEELEAALAYDQQTHTGYAEMDESEVQELEADPTEFPDRSDLLTPAQIAQLEAAERG